MATSTVHQILTPEQLEANKAEKVVQVSGIIENIDSRTLLAHPDTLERVTWQKTSNGHLLVTKSSLEEIARSNAADAKGSTPLGDPAILAIVCKVSRDGTFLTTDGGYPSRYTLRLTDAKFTLALESPSQDAWARDYEKSLLNIEELLAQVTKEERDRVGFKAVDGDIIKLKHTVFQAVDEFTDEEDYKATRDWPVTSDAAVEALQGIIDNGSHVVQHMPAYNLVGELIEPVVYFGKLVGATVVVRFTLQHYIINKKDKNGGKATTDTFAATLDHLRIAVNPEGRSPVTPRRKKPRKVDAIYGDWSPTKRRHDSGGEEPGDKDQGSAGKTLRKRSKPNAVSSAGASTSRKKT